MNKKKNIYSLIIMVSSLLLTQNTFSHGGGGHGGHGGGGHMGGHHAGGGHHHDGGHHNGYHGGHGYHHGGYYGRGGYWAGGFGGWAYGNFLLSFGIMSALTYSATYPYRSSYDDRYYKTQDDADRAQQAAENAQSSAQRAEQAASQAEASEKYNQGFAAGVASVRQANQE